MLTQQVTKEALVQFCNDLRTTQYLEYNPENIALISAGVVAVVLNDCISDAKPEEVQLVIAEDRNAKKILAGNADLRCFIKVSRKSALRTTANAMPSNKGNNLTWKVLFSNDPSIKEGPAQINELQSDLSLAGFTHYSEWMNLSTLRVQLYSTEAIDQTINYLSYYNQQYNYGNNNNNGAQLCGSPEQRSSEPKCGTSISYWPGKAAITSGQAPNGTGLVGSFEKRRISKGSLSFQRVSYTGSRTNSTGPEKWPKEVGRTGSGTVPPVSRIETEPFDELPF